MRKGDIIKCNGEKDAKQMLKDLGLAGFHAVVMHVNCNWIRITGEPDTEYLVSAHDQGGRMQNAYCDTLEEAEDIAGEYGNQYEFVEIMKGYAGEWESVSKSW